MDLMKEIAGITDVKCDCTLQELTGYINTMAQHFDGKSYTEEDVLLAVRCLEDDEKSDVVLVKGLPGVGYTADNLPWLVIHTRAYPKFVPPGYDDVPS